MRVPSSGAILEVGFDKGDIKSFFDCFRTHVKVSFDEIEDPGSFSNCMIDLIFPSKVLMNSDAQVSEALCLCQWGVRHRKLRQDSVCETSALSYI